MQQVQQPQQNINQQKLINMQLTLPHSTILVQSLEKLIAAGVEGMALAPGAKEGDPNYMPPSMVAAHLAEIATGLHKAIMETVKKLQEAQTQAQLLAQQQAMMGANQPGMFGTGQMPDDSQAQPQQITPEMAAMMQGITDLGAPGVNQVPLTGQAPGMPPGNAAPTLMPQPNASSNPNVNATGPNGAAGSPIIVDPNAKP